MRGSKDEATEPAKKALVPSLWLYDGVPDLGAAVGALVDEVDLRHAPVGFDVPDEHGKQSDASGADDRSCLDFVMVHVGWHVSPLLQRESQPAPIYLRMADAHHQLFRTYEERTYIVRACCIPVTFQSAGTAGIALVIAAKSCLDE